MATGDLQNNIDKARNELTSIKFDGVWNNVGITEGTPEAYLPLVHHVCVNFSRFIARFLASKGYELVGKNDLRFVEEVYKILRNEFNYRPALNVAQFFTVGFAERKLILVCDLIKLCKRKHNELSKQQADAKRRTVSSPSPSLLHNTSKHDAGDMDSSLRKSGGSLSKSGSGNLDGSQRMRNGSTSGILRTSPIPKKFVASASLVNTEIDVADSKPNASAARPPIRVIRNTKNESFTSNQASSNNHPNPITTNSYSPSTNNYIYSLPTHPQQFNASFSSYNTDTSHHPPINQSNDGGGTWDHGDGLRNNGFMTEELEVEDVDGDHEEAAHEHKANNIIYKQVQMNGKDEGRRSIDTKEYHDSHKIGFENGDASPTNSSLNDKVAFLIIDKLAQMEARLLTSITNIQTTMVSLESRMKNLENTIGGGSTSKHVVYEAPQYQVHSHKPNYTTEHQAPSPANIKMPNITTSQPEHRDEITHNSHGYKTTLDTSVHRYNTSSSTNKDYLAFQSTPQSTQDFITSITKRFRDTKELLSQQTKQDFVGDQKQL